MHRTALIAVIALLSAWPTGAQSFDPQGLDQRILSAVNGSENPWSRRVFGGADYTAYPVFYGALPAVWAPVVVTGSGRDLAVDASLAMVGSYVAAVGLKQLVRRQRPIAVHPWIVSRTHYPGGRDLDPHSWPSGHATLAAALAGTLSLRNPRWYVIAPAAAWAVAVGGSRMWLGVHYPSDVVSGWALGFGAAVLVHKLRNKTDPESLGGSTVFTISLPIG